MKTTYRCSAKMVCVFFALLCVAFSTTTLARTRTHSPETDCGDEVADQQGVSVFNSLLDGQPTDPQKPTASFSLSRVSRTAQLQTAIQISPGKQRGACDAVISFLLPTVTLDDKVHLGQSAGLGWEQRWHADDGQMPTFATSVSAVIDYSQPKWGVAVTGTFIAVKSVRELALYANVFVTYAKAPGSVATWTPGFIIGVKTPTRADDALVIDLVVKKSAPASIEFGYQLPAPDKFNIGPGIAVSLESRPQFTLGIVIQKEF